MVGIPSGLESERKIGGTLKEASEKNNALRRLKSRFEFSLFNIFAFHFETTGGPHRDASEPWSDDEDDTWADTFLSELQHHINDRTFDHRFVR
ncbi:hypothetical protein AVEN_130966-1 [Araneus ventricosus]|uniref:Uncharacterized protein n=1 Tax=Araneus ventricosus TaxID=182803 RepID=A0A4Y2LTT8_ARAVE|nr:hypothetical protein AVEN_130966-1 [Araneus ventricosus]